ncbi:glycosyltransferase [Marinomonas rhizomae]|uniref:Glycosyltransferase involved in cell wall biosynthesis n=1 Tax=Marinomonas rhizomae TaxID=491948 RepID=A0A366JAD0_9GAMM|nr:glycosyltransferase [Marinomonas rhizomae]RBP83244.1 glycosyltransferase involved in cell wall biosynthesis [Marinomonas rhizomae]RNF69414.1 glycosyltransferase [Marinomonas rhizomae]
MKRILYIVSTLGKSGPTNQLYNIISNQDLSNFNITILTLSEERENSDKRKFDSLNIKIETLALSRIKSFFLAIRYIKKMLRKIKPDLIHSQGLRADILLSKMNLKIPWVITARNFPPEDYISKFGKIKGRLLVWQHLSALKKCKNVVSCSHSVAGKLKGIGVPYYVIQNGVDLSNMDSTINIDTSCFKSPVFISMGALIPRKNMVFLISIMKKYFENNDGCLIILGDGPEMLECNSISNDRIHLLGNVNSVGSYLNITDYFISASLSEGLPNAVLESLSAGVPAILSDIDSHLEISNICPMISKVFLLSSESTEIHKTIEMIVEEFNANFDQAYFQNAREQFSAKSMSSKYTEKYLGLIN